MRVAIHWGLVIFSALGFTCTSSASCSYPPPRLMTFFIGEKYMFITPKLQFSHLGCKANPTTEADMVPDAVSVLRRNSIPGWELGSKGPTCRAVPSGRAVNWWGPAQGQGGSQGSGSWHGPQRSEELANDSYWQWVPPCTQAPRQFYFFHNYISGTQQLSFKST